MNFHRKRKISCCWSEAFYQNPVCNCDRELIHHSMQFAVINEHFFSRAGGRSLIQRFSTLKNDSCDAKEGEKEENKEDKSNGEGDDDNVRHSTFIFHLHRNASTSSKERQSVT